MSNDQQKKSEIAVAELAAIIVQEPWVLSPDEEPDFIVSTPDERFGLELTQCFSGDFKRGGSVDRKDAAFRQKKLNEIRARCLIKFPEIEHWNLQYLFKWNDDVETHIVNAIEQAQADQDKQVGYPIFPEEQGDALPPFIFIQKCPNFVIGAPWTIGADHAPHVVTSDVPLQKAINDKKEKVPAYRKKSNDIRLLVYASPFNAAENVSLREVELPNLCGFDKVYFMHIPNYVVEFSSEQDGSVTKNIHTFTGRTPQSFTIPTESH